MTEVTRCDRPSTTAPSRGDSQSRKAEKPGSVGKPGTNVKARGSMGSATGFRVAGTGSYLPDQVVTNEDLAALGCDSDWIVRRTGILQRRKAGDDQATSDLCIGAAEKALAAAGKTASDLDLILVATITPDHPTPSTACHVQRQLGATASAMDVNAALMAKIS